jgi:uncharacterized Fe-S radical SAM superfamily protein PflX
MLRLSGSSDYPGWFITASHQLVAQVKDVLIRERNKPCQLLTIKLLSTLTELFPSNQAVMDQIRPRIEIITAADHKHKKRQKE